MSSSTSCPQGWIDDAFLLYFPVPCSLNVIAHQVLFCVWSALFILALVELAIEQFWLKQSRSTVTSRILYFCYLVSSLIFCLYTAIKPMASVLNLADGAVLWTTIVFNMTFCMAMASSIGIQVMKSMTDSMVHGMGKTTNLTKEQATITFRVARVLVFMVPVIMGVLGLVLFSVLPQTLTDLQWRTNVVNGGFILYGLAVIINPAILCLTMMLIRRTTLSLIRFHSSLARTGDVKTSTVTSLEALADRCKHSALLVAPNGFVSGVIWIIMALWFHERYWVAHLFFGPCSILAILAYLTFNQSALTIFLFRSRTATTPEASTSSSKTEPSLSRSNSLSNSLGTIFHSTSPSKLLETINVESLK